MKRPLIATTAAIASSFTPVALPALVSGAAAVPSPNVLLCTDTSSLGPSQNGHYWGNPYILPVDVTVRTTFEGPFSSGDTEYFVATETTTTDATFQRCPVFNRLAHRTGKYQDVQVAPSGTSVRVFNCQTDPTAAGEALGYQECPAGGSRDER